MEHTANKKIIPLCCVPCGKKGRVKELSADGSIRRRMLDLGLVLDTIVECLRRSPFGDPTAYEIRGTVIALRYEEASKILVELV